MKSYHFILALCGLAAIISSPAFADELSESLLAKSVNAGAAAGVPDRPSFAGAKPQLQLTADSDDANVQLAWNLVSSSSTTTDQDLTLSDFDRFSLLVSTELAKGSGPTTLFGLSGFSGGTEVKLKWTHLSGVARNPFSNPANAAKYKAAVDAAAANCRSANRQVSPKALTAKCDPSSNDFDGSDSSLIAEYADQFDKSINRLVFPKPMTLFYGLDVAGSQKSFDYLDRASFSVKSADRFSYAATAFIGGLSNRTPSSIAASFTYGRRNRAQDEVTICQPIAAPQTQCITGADGLPKRSKKAVFSIEGRHAFSFAPNGGKARLAIAPEASFDAESKAYSFNVPVYFAPNKDGDLKGGVRFGYVNARDATGKRDGDFAAVLFVGVPFGLF